MIQTFVNIELNKFACFAQVFSEHLLILSAGKLKLGHWQQGNITTWRDSTIRSDWLVCGLNMTLSNIYATYGNLWTIQLTQTTIWSYGIQPFCKSLGKGTLSHSLNWGKTLPCPTLVLPSGTTSWYSKWMVTGWSRYPHVYGSNPIISTAGAADRPASDWGTGLAETDTETVRQHTSEATL